MRIFNREEVERIWRMKGGGMTAPSVSILFDVNPETIRRIWRGENYREITSTLGEFTAPTNVESEDSIARVMEKVRMGLEGEEK